MTAFQIIDYLRNPAQKKKHVPTGTQD